MKKALYVLLLIAGACALFAVPKIAVLNPTLDKTIDDVVASPIMDKILEELLKSRKFNIVDRASRDIIWEERNFQISSGEIDQKEIKNIGQGLGADYIVVVKVKRIGTLYSMSTTMINVETLEVVAQSSAEAKDSIENLLQLASYCGAQIADTVSGNSSGTAKPNFDLTTADTDTTVSSGNKLSPDPDGSADEVYAIKARVRKLIQSKTFLKPDGRDRISAAVGALTLRDKNSLYDEYKKDTGMAVIAMLVNWFTGPLMIGSFIQGDINGAVGYMIAEGLCAVIIIAAATDGLYQTVGTGLGLLVGCWILSGFQPYTFMNSWNKKLSNSLGVVAIGPQAPSVKLAEGAGSMGYQATLVSYRY